MTSHSYLIPMRPTGVALQDSAVQTSSPWPTKSDETVASISFSKTEEPHSSLRDTTNATIPRRLAVCSSRPSMFLILAILPGVVFLSMSGYVLHAYSVNLGIFDGSDSFHKLGIGPNHSRHLPHCLIIGVRKGGTRAVLKFLSIHPSVAVAGREAHFFDRDTRYRHGLEWYRRRMPMSTPNQLTVEKTPAYFHHPLVPRRIKRFRPNVKLIVVLRDPVERTISDYTQVLSNRRKKGRKYFNFEDLAFKGGIVKPEGVRSGYQAIWRSMYNVHMHEWLRYFPLSSFHFVDGKRLVFNPAFEIRRVENFLGIPNFITPKHFYFNESRGFYCLQKGGCLANSKGRKHPSLNSTIITTLQRFFSPHIKQFYHQIWRDFGWYIP